MCRGSATSQVSLETGPLTVLVAEEAEESRPWGPGVILLVVLGSTVHSPTRSNLLTRLTWAFRCCWAVPVNAMFHYVLP